MADPGRSISSFAEASCGQGLHPAIVRYLRGAIAAVREQGVELGFGSFEELARTNASNRRSWARLTPAFDPACSRLSAQEAFCILGRDRAGDVVATQAVRVYDWRQTTFHDEAESMRLFYADPARMRAQGEGVIVTASAAKAVSGFVAYSGAGWYRPDHRHGRLSSLLPRISRAVTLALFSVDFTAAIMHESAVKTGLIARSGHRNVDWEVRTRNFRAGDGRCAFLWLSRSEMLDDLAGAAQGVPEVDAGVLE